MSAQTEFERAERRLFDDLSLPYTVHYLQLAHPPRRTRVLEAGSPTGEPVLLIHGGGAFGAGWAPLMAQLRDFRVLAVDRPGCGLTDGFDYRGVDLRRHAVSFQESLLDALQLESASVIGSSMGGLWSLWLALDRPERLRRLVLIACPALVLGTGAPLGLRLLSVPLLNRVLMALEPPSHAQYVRLMARLGEAREVVQSLPRSMEEVFLAAERLSTYQQGWLSLLECAVSLTGGRPEYTLGEDDFQRVRQPTLLEWGERDPFGGLEVARRACGLLPHGRLVEVPRAGHLPWLDAPQLCGDAVTEHLEARALARVR